MPDTDQTINTRPIDALVPLSDLYIHPLNVRSEPPALDIEILANSIADLGLLQNLSGFSDDEGPKDYPLAVGIVAGGRRLRALQLLAEREGRKFDEVKVRVRITNDAATARIWASAENSARQSLHPADEIRAYGKMAVVGADPAQIARAFAVTSRHVQQRLKLATLPDAALQSLRDGKLTLDQAGALTIARDEDALLAELRRATTSNWHISADQIRQSLRGTSVSGNDRRFKFIGPDAYQDAGGIVVADLFTDQIRVQDADLLQTLFDQALSAECEIAKSRGWKWVEPYGEFHPPYEDSNKLDRIHRIAVDLPDADTDELAALSDKSETEELTEAELARFEELETRAAGDYSDDDIATSGIWLYVDNQGQLCTHGPYRDPKDDPARLADDESDDAAPVPTESRALPANLTEDLSRIRLAALHIRAADQPELMLDLLAFHLSGNLKPWAQALNLTISPPSTAPEKPEGTTIPDRLRKASDKYGSDEVKPEAFANFRALGKKHRNDALAHALAVLIPNNDLAPSLAGKLRPDVRSIWTPTKSGYLARLPVAALDDLWCHLTPDDRTPTHANFRDLKKGEKADLLHKLFNDSDWREAFGLSRDENTRIDAWLPAELEWPATNETEDD